MAAKRPLVIASGQPTTLPAGDDIIVARAVTAAQLATLVSGNGIVPNAFYRITDGAEAGRIAVGLTATNYQAYAKRTDSDAVASLTGTTWTIDGTSGIWLGTIATAVAHTANITLGEGESVTIKVVATAAGTITGTLVSGVSWAATFTQPTSGKWQSFTVSKIGGMLTGWQVSQA